MESLLQLFRSISAMMSSVSDQTLWVKVGPRSLPWPRSRPAPGCRAPGPLGGAAAPPPSREARLALAGSRTLPLCEGWRCPLWASKA